jgi:hypothetical protein
MPGRRLANKAQPTPFPFKNSDGLPICFIMRGYHYNPYSFTGLYHKLFSESDSVWVGTNSPVILIRAKSPEIQHSGISESYIQKSPANQYPQVFNHS